MKRTTAILTILALFVLVLPAHAGTTAPPLLSITIEGTVQGKKTRRVPVFDKWTDGATVAVADLGTDGVSEIVAGAGPGSAPEVRILRQDGSLIKKWNVFDADFRGGVTVAVGDVDYDGTNEIVVGAGPRGGPHVKVYDGTGAEKYEFFAFPPGERGGIQVSAGYGSIAAAQFGGTNPLARTYQFDGTTFNLSREVPREVQPRAELNIASVQTVSVSVPAPHFENGKPEMNKIIEIDISEQRLYAYERGSLATTFLVSTGLPRWPTPIGKFKVMRKVEKMDYRWSYGPNNPNNYFLPNVKWNVQFKKHYYIHQAYWHNAFGNWRSHGCVNSREADAKFIYDWSELETPVTVKL